MSSHNYAAARHNSNKRKAKSSLAATESNPSKKSKSAIGSNTSSTKRTERLNDLNWRSISLPQQLSFDEDGGMLELDEVEGVEVVYGDGGVTFQVRDDGEKKKSINKSKKPSAMPLVENSETDYISPFPDEDLSQFQQDTDPALSDEANGSNTQPNPTNNESTAIEKSLKAAKGKKKAAEKLQEDLISERTTENFDVAKELPNWAHLPLAPTLYRALAELKFDTPTAIQERALSVEMGAKPFVEPAYERESQPEEEADEHFVSQFDEEPAASTAPESRDRDVVGVAQTGSGKTLAYGLPILSWILTQPVHEPGTSRLAGLILAPTRELALQVRSALSEVSIRTAALLPDNLQNSDANGPRKRERAFRHISIVALTGGMSIDKQKRQLQRGADILVATPGRLWDLISENDALGAQIKRIKFLVIDEADRMIENGHFAELENIVKLTRRENESDLAGQEAFLDDFESGTPASKITARPDLRTFVFSATMSKNLQRNLKKRNRKFQPGVAEDNLSSLDDLLLKLDFRDPEPQVIDLSPEGGLVASLSECKIECLVAEKDVYLYHFLLRYPGRTIVFLSSIDGIRRLYPLLELLRLPVLHLHSGMQQRARLKTLDRFKSSPNAILLATDVAARGLDIPSVSHVVHYQLPRTADTYVHRSGRTARAGKEGLALQLIAPEEKQTQKLLMASLGKTNDLRELPTEFSILDQLKKRLELAKKIENLAHKATKQAHEENWLKEAAAALEIELEGEEDLSDGENSGRSTKKVSKGKSAQLKDLRAQLRDLLDAPIMMRGVSAKYLTTRSRVNFVDQLVEGRDHGELKGVETRTALQELAESGNGKNKAKKSAE